MFEKRNERATSAAAYDKLTVVPTVVSGALEGRDHASAFFVVGNQSGRSRRWDGLGRSGRSARVRVRTAGRTRVGGGVVLNNRYHDPSTGTFLSVDPLVGQTGMPYLYGNGNPTTFSDPTGLFAQCELNDSCAGGSNAPGRPKATTPVVTNEDAVVRELHRCMNGFRTCNEQRTDARNAGESTPILDLVVDFLYGMAANGILRQNSEGGLVSSNPNQTAQVFGFSVSQENQKFVVLAIAADVNPGTVETLLEDIGLLLNLAELGVWGSCAATGITCPATIPLSGASTAMDVVNASVDAGQGGWGEAFTGVATLGMGQVAGRTVDAWPTALPGRTGSRTLAGLNVGGAEFVMSSALEGLNGVYTGPDGSVYDFDGFTRSYVVAP